LIWRIIFFIIKTIRKDVKLEKSNQAEGSSGRACQNNLKSNLKSVRLDLFVFYHFGYFFHSRGIIFVQTL